MDNVSSKELFDELVFILETSLWTWEWSDPNDEEDTSPEHQLCRDIRRMHHIVHLLMKRYGVSDSEAQKDEELKEQMAMRMQHFVEAQKDVPIDIQEIVDKRFWDMV